MARRPKTSKEKTYVVIKKSPDPMSVYMVAVKLELSSYTIQMRMIPDLIVNGCIEEVPPYYATMMSMLASDEFKVSKGAKVKFYRISKDHSCDFCKVF